MGAEVIQLEGKKPGCKQFALIPVALIRDRRVKHATFRYWAGLASFADSDGKCWVGPEDEKKLHDRVGMSRQTCAGHRKVLEDLGLLEVVAEGRPDGRRGPYYRLLVGNSDNVDLSETPTELVGNSDKSCRKFRHPPTPPYIAPDQVPDQEPDRSLREQRARGDDLFSDRLPDEGKADRAPASQPTPKKPKPVGDARATLETYQPDKEILAWAASNAPGVDVRACSEQWRDHHRAKGTRIKDYDASLRTWLRNEVTYAARRSAWPAPTDRGRGNKPTALETALAEVARYEF